MKQNPASQAPETPASSVLTPVQLRALAREIVASGVLGRSKKYGALLEFLVECSIESKSPKEIELAVSVLGKNESFDVSSDSSVRVYVHQLRKKLDNYYRDFDKTSAHRIIIPRGQYTVAATSHSSLHKTGGGKTWSIAEPFQIKGLLIAAVILLAANLIYLVKSNSRTEPDRLNSVASHAIWKSVLEDQHPIMLVMGDYYIFGELNANGNIARMVREFNVNSSSDLEDLQFQDI